MNKLSFGNRLPNSGPLAAPAAIVTAAKASEALGFDGIWVHDHLTWTEEIHKTHISSGAEEALGANDKPDFYEAMTTLAYLAGIIGKARLGIACMVVPCRNPIYAAKQAASLDVMSGGRLDLGIGIGSPATIQAREYEVLGANRRMRGKICDDYVRAMKTIWTSHPATYRGEFVNFTEAEIFPKPLQKPHPPLWVGGWTEAAVKRTARLGDRWLPAWLKPPDIAAKFEQVKAMARAEGRNAEAIELGIEVYVSIDRDSERAKRDAIGTFKASRSTYERAMSLDFLRDVSLIGSPEEIRLQVRAYAQAGVSHFETKFIYPTVDRLLEMMQLFAAEVITPARENQFLEHCRPAKTVDTKASSSSPPQ
jgi:probable F420-dependent oxidoreductase